MREPERAQVAFDEHHIEKRPVLVDDEGLGHSAGRRIELAHDPRAKRHDADGRLHVRLLARQGQGPALRPIDTHRHGQSRGCPGPGEARSANARSLDALGGRGTAESSPSPPTHSRCRARSGTPTPKRRRREALVRARRLRSSMRWHCERARRQRSPQETPSA